MTVCLCMYKGTVDIKKGSVYVSGGEGEETRDTYKQRTYEQKTCR